MGNARTQPGAPDLFSTASDREPPSPLADSRAPSQADSKPRHVLPRDLPSAIKHLNDQELARLIAAALAEQKRRGAKARTSIEPVRNVRAKTVVAPLTTGKLNAVRAAFKAGVKPTHIARQFGLSDAEVRRALASEEKKR